MSRKKKKKKDLIRVEPSNSEWCEIRDSPIHGRGLYATKAIPDETYIIEYVGERIDKDESNRRGWDRIGHAKETGEAAVYIFALNDEFDIDGSGDENHARLINHSCDPNCEAYVCGEDEGLEPSIWICAIRDIEKGEELFFNYGFDLDCYEDHPCRCGSRVCVGYIAGEEYWDELKKKLARKKAKKKKQRQRKKREKAKA